MKCPHCLVEYHDKPGFAELGSDCVCSWKVIIRNCPNCIKANFILLGYNYVIESGRQKMVVDSETLFYPKGSQRNPVPIEVPEVFAKDYSQACLVLADSPMASAALSRRCLQHIIREELKIKDRTLDQEIQKVIEVSKLPSDILESIDAIRSIGNFAAHPIKSQSSGEIVDVEPGEAEWNLDVLEMLFDNLFVAPAIRKQKRDALNAKLKDAGKPEMK